MRARDIASYLFLAVAWGLSFLVLVKVVAAFGWVGAVTLRCLLASATLIVVAKVRRRALAFSLGWRPYAVVGATTVAAQLIGLSYGTPLIGTAMAAILVAAIPLFSMVISQLWGLERMTLRRFVGLCLGMAGIVLLVGFPAVPVTPHFILGCAACLFASLSAAFGSNYASLHLRSAGSLEVTAGSFLAGGLMTLPLLLAVPVPTMPGPV
ncbi:MAG: EamA family transporter, partial [Mesorhizobium sp.]|nr:EamA family transporter [Mesorhizobium sp.]